MVTWQRPQFPNGIIRGYQIRYIPQGGNDQTLNVGPADSSTLLIGLEIYKLYYISVSVQTIQYSNFTNDIAVSTDEGGKH